MFSEVNWHPLKWQFCRGRSPHGLEAPSEILPTDVCTGPFNQPIDRAVGLGILQQQWWVDRTGNPNYIGAGLLLFTAGSLL
jgi:hypothetical protein